jgi:hypothetical protein
MNGVMGKAVRRVLGYIQGLLNPFPDLLGTLGKYHAFTGFLYNSGSGIALEFFQPIVEKQSIDLRTFPPCHDPLFGKYGNGHLDGDIPGGLL